METAVNQSIRNVVNTLKRFQSGEAEARISTLEGAPGIEELRTALNSVLAEAAATAEQLHTGNMNMAIAMTEWFDVLGEAGRGNLEARVKASYGDEFLDKLGQSINQALAGLKARDEAAAQQAKLVSELSTPILQIWDRVLALPIIGVVDTMRAQEMMEKLLGAVVQHQALVVIIDITGVVAVDTRTADYLIKMVKAAGLVGAQAIVVGINPEVAQTVTRMGLDLKGITTLRDLRAGLKAALRIVGGAEDRPEGAAHVR